MYSAWSTSLISGLVAGVGIAIVSAVQLGSSSMPEPLPVAFIAGGTVVAALVAGTLVALVVRLGLLLAGSPWLTVRFVLTIAGLTVALLGILGTVSMETHAVKLDMPSYRSTPLEIPFAFWLAIVAAISVPLLISYVVGRMGRGRVDAA